MPNKLRWLLLVISFASLISCTPKPPDVPTCEHLPQHLGTDPITGHMVLKPSPDCMAQIGEPECGHCVTIMTGAVSFIGENAPHLLNGKKWSEVRTSAIYLPAKESYEPLAKYIIDSCKVMNCSAEVTKFKVRVSALQVVPALP